MVMNSSVYYKKGDHNAICDRCGFKDKASKLKQEWTGLYVCKECWEPRHPQEFLKGVKDDPSVKWTRPDAPENDIDTSGWITPPSVPDGTFDGGLEESIPPVAIGASWATGAWAEDVWGDVWA